MDDQRVRDSSIRGERYCNNCGQELRPEARFCTECGRTLAVPVSPGYVAASGWPAQSEADREPAAGPLPPSGSAAADPAAPPWEHDHWLAFDPSGQPPGEQPPKRARWPLLAAITAAAVLTMGAGIALVALPFHHGPASTADAAQKSAAAKPSSPNAAQGSAAASSPAPTSRERAARALSALLAQSSTDRTTVIHAAGAVEDCSAGLSENETTFAQSASARQALLGKLAALPGRSALPAQTLEDLTLAWQASGEADQDFARWTQDEIARGCSTDDQSDANFRAALAPDTTADTYKDAFATLWTAIATQYGLPVYQSSQI